MYLPPMKTVIYGVSFALAFTMMFVLDDVDTFLPPPSLDKAETFSGELVKATAVKYKHHNDCSVSLLSSNDKRTFKLPIYYCDPIGSPLIKGRQYEAKLYRRFGFISAIHVLEMTSRNERVFKLYMEDNSGGDGYLNLLFIFLGASIVCTYLVHSAGKKDA